MTNLANYTQIARLVKSWADKLDEDTMATYSPVVVALINDMRAFSNGLEHTVETFAPIVAKINEAVAEANDVTLGGMEIRQCGKRGIHPPHYWRDLKVYACNGRLAPPMVPEEI